MEIQLTRKIGLKGFDMVGQWIATVSNDYGDVVVEGKAITPNGALREIESQLEEALRAVQEMMKPSSEDSGMRSQNRHIYKG